MQQDVDMSHSLLHSATETTGNNTTKHTNGMNFNGDMYSSVNNNSDN
jgi:hypothetical protein